MEGGHKKRMPERLSRASRAAPREQDLPWDKNSVIPNHPIRTKDLRSGSEIVCAKGAVALSSPGVGISCIVRIQGVCSWCDGGRRSNANGNGAAARKCDSGAPPPRDSNEPTANRSPPKSGSKPLPIRAPRGHAAPANPNLFVTAPAAMSLDNRRAETCLVIVVSHADESCDGYGTESASGCAARHPPVVLSGTWNIRPGLGPGVTTHGRQFYPARPRLTRRSSTMSG